MKMFLPLLCFGLLLARTGECQVMTDDGLQIYWDVMARLAEEESLSPQEWEELWDSPGFNSWMDTGRSRKIFHNYYTLIGDPSLSDPLSRDMEQSIGYRVRIFDHLLEAKERREELKIFTQDLLHSDVIERAKEIAFKFLPDTLDVSGDSTLIALMLFQPDAFAMPERNQILLDILYALNYGDGFEKFLAHELHHVYSAKYLSRLKEVEYENEYFPLVWSVDKLRNEGIADLIDKEFIHDKPQKTEYDIEYIAHYANSRQHLQVIDSLLEEIVDDTSRVEELGKDIRRQLPYGAHPTGLYIAHIIREHAGREGILACLESPFTFLYLYNDIALQSDGEYHTFSNRSIDYLRQLEVNYVE